MIPLLTKLTFRYGSSNVMVDDTTVGSNAPEVILRLLMNHILLYTCLTDLIT